MSHSIGPLYPVLVQCGALDFVRDRWRDPNTRFWIAVGGTEYYTYEELKQTYGDPSPIAWGYVSDHELEEE